MLSALSHDVFARASFTHADEASSRTLSSHSGSPENRSPDHFDETNNAYIEQEHLKTSLGLSPLGVDNSIIPISSTPDLPTPDSVVASVDNYQLDSSDTRSDYTTSESLTGDTLSQDYVLDDNPRRLASGETDFAAQLAHLLREVLEERERELSGRHHLLADNNWSFSYRDDLRLANELSSSSPDAVQTPRALSSLLAAGEQEVEAYDGVVIFSQDDDEEATSPDAHSLVLRGVWTQKDEYFGSHSTRSPDGRPPQLRISSGEGASTGQSTSASSSTSSRKHSGTDLTELSQEHSASQEEDASYSEDTGKGSELSFTPSLASMIKTPSNVSTSFTPIATVSSADPQSIERVPSAYQTLNSGSDLEHSLPTVPCTPAPAARQAAGDHSSSSAPLHTVSGLKRPRVEGHDDVLSSLEPPRKRMSGGPENRTSLARPRAEGAAIMSVRRLKNGASSFALASHEPASLRRARSLRSDSSKFVYDADKENNADGRVLGEPSRPFLAPVNDRTPLGRRDSNSTLSPLTTAGRTIYTVKKKSSSARSRLAVLHPVPAWTQLPHIELPPYERISRVRITEDERAEERLRILVAREDGRRAEDRWLTPEVERAKAPLARAGAAAARATRNGSASGSSGSEPTPPLATWEEEMEEEVLQDVWKADWERRMAEEMEEDVRDSDPGYSSPGSEIPDVDAERRRWADKYAIDDALRRDVVQWLLEVAPLEGDEVACDDLVDQLSSFVGGETRFHAAYLFNRYFLQLGIAIDEKKRLIAWNAHHDVSESEFLVKDVGVACMAISVKFHRDVLWPLNPVYAVEFVDLARHEMSFDELESSQRTILNTLGYRISGPSPAAYLDELWLALPTLRKLLDFRHGWRIARKVTWEVLLDAVAEPDYVQFPVYVLTASALGDGLVDALMIKYADSAQRRTASVAASGHLAHPATAEAIEQRISRWHRRAESESKGIMSDVREALNISQETLAKCTAWIASMAE